MKRGLRSKRIVIAVLAAGIGLAAVLCLRWKPKPDGLMVPLGVEQAAIITYSGSLLTVAPYKWGVAVNVRLAEVVEQADRRVYDVRYIVNRAGTFDLRDYLAASDGSALEGLPEFRFTGDATLSKDLDARIEETEELRMDVGGHYYEIAAILGLLWLGWLLLLIFYKRPRAVEAVDPVSAGPAFAEWLRDFLARLETGNPSASDKAELEMQLLRRWREELALDAGTSMSEGLHAMSNHARTALPLRKLQHWLHHPASPVPSAEIAALLEPYARESSP